MLIYYIEWARHRLAPENAPQIPAIELLGEGIKDWVGKYDDDNRSMEVLMIALLEDLDRMEESVPTLPVDLIDLVAEYMYKISSQQDPRHVEVPMPDSSGMDGDSETLDRIRLKIDHRITFRFVERAFKNNRSVAVAAGLPAVSERLIDRLAPLEDDLVQELENLRAAFDAEPEPCPQATLERGGGISTSMVIGLEGTMVDGTSGVEEANSPPQRNAVTGITAGVNQSGRASPESVLVEEPSERQEPADVGPVIN